MAARTSLQTGLRGWLAVVADGVERVGRAVAGLRDDLAPVGVVARSELREQADERAVGGGFDRVAKRRGRELGAASLEDPSACDDVLEQNAQALVVGRQSGLHGPLSGLALVGLWGRPAQRLLGSREAREAFLDLVGLVLGKQDEDDRAVVAGFGRRLLHCRLGDRPLVANPDRNVALVDRRARPGPSGCRSCGVSCSTPWVSLRLPSGAVDRGDEPLAAELVHSGGVVADGGESARGSPSPTRRPLRSGGGTRRRCA